MFTARWTRVFAFALLLSAPLLTASQSNTAADFEAMFPTLARYRVADLSKATMDQVALNFEVVERVNDRTFEVLVPHRDRKMFLSIAPGAMLVRDDDAAGENISIFNQGDALAGYRNFPGLVAEVNKLAADHPDIVQVVPYGMSTQGKQLFAVKVSDNVADDEDEPELMIDAATHGDEIISVEVVMGIMNQLIAGYDTDADKAAMINDHEIYFIPVVSPDSYVARQRYVDGQDPNRQYPWPAKPERTSVRPIKSLIDFFQSRNFAGLLSFHASGEMIMYPWAYTTNTIENQQDYKTYVELAKRMSATNGYTQGQISRILYAAPGSSADFYYWQKRTIAYGIEVAQSKAPPFGQVQAIVDENAKMVWEFIGHF